MYIYKQGYLLKTFHLYEFPGHLYDNNNDGKSDADIDLAI